MSVKNLPSLFTWYLPTFLNQRFIPLASYMGSLSKQSLYYPWSTFWVDDIYRLILEDMEVSYEVK